MAKNKAKMNKFLTGAITASLVATAVAPVASAAAFTDLDRVDESVKAEIDNAVELGFFNDGTKFNPSAKITRGQAALTLARYIAGDQSVKAYAEANDLEDKVTAFKDVPASYKNGADFQQELYYASLIVKDAEAFTQTNLNPAGDVTRSQMAKIITETFDLKKVEGYESTITDIDHLDAGTKTFIETIASHGVTNVDTFNPAGHVTRSQMASFLVRSYDVVNPSVDAPEITGVSAINATQAKVTFKNAVPKDVDFSNFDINGGLTVTNVELSADRKSATITVNPEFVRNQEYTVSVFGVLDADGKEYAESKGKFTWEVAEGVVVALETTTLDQGETVGLTVKDAGGKDVKDAKVTVTSLNTNLVTATPAGSQSPKDIKVTANNDKLAGTTDVLVETELPDGSILNNTFKVTVKEAVTTVANAGYTLANIAAPSTTTAYANTLSFKNYGKQVTSLVEGSGAVELVAFGETNGNPDVTHLDFTDAKVTSSNAIVATATVDGAGKITVTPLKAGTTTVQVTMEDGSRKSFPVTVTATPVITDLNVDATTVNLSDENRTETTPDGTTGQEGVDAKEITVKTLDQYKAVMGSTAGKVTVTSSTDGIKLFDDAAGTNEYKTGSNELSITSGTDSFFIQAQKDKPVSNAKVTVSYFKDANDTKPAITKTITVNVADVKVTDLTADIDVVAGNQIDANAKNLSTGVDEIDFSTEVYAVNSAGNRIENLSAAATTTATLDAANTEAAKYVDATTSIVSFADVNKALTYLRAESTVNVEVAVTETAGPSNGQVVTKIIPVTYKNTAVVPNKVSVATSPIAIKLPAAGTITYDEIIFGKLDPTQLIKDDVEEFDLLDTHVSHLISPLKTAKNAGYEFNKSIISVTGTDGKALNTGAALYGNLATQADGNIWTTKAIEDLTKSTTKFVAGSEEFEYEFAIANVAGDVTPGATDVTLAAGQSSTFTLVLSGVYVKNSVTVEGAADLAAATAEQKAKHNLLSAPVQLNVSVSAE